MTRTVHAPEGLRRRVIGNVRSGPSRREPAAGRAVRTALLRAAPLALPTAFAAVAFAILPGAGSSPRAAPAPASAPGRGAPRAALHVTAGRGELTIAGDPQSPPGKIYELWERRSGVPRLLPTDALFAVAHGERAAVGVPGSLRGLRQLLVTLEPVGGSAVPTGPTLLRIAPPGASR